MICGGMAVKRMGMLGVSVRTMKALFFFNIHGTLHHNSMSINVQQDATYTQFILCVNCPTCFGWFLHSSPGAQITVSTASGTSQQ